MLHLSTPDQAPAPVRAVRLLWLVLAALVLGACDNPACVFTAGGCQTGSGTEAVLGGEAQAPFDGARVRNGLPQIEAVFPVGNNINADSPIVIRFSESMNAASLVNAFRIVDAIQISPFPIVTTNVLTGDGQLLVLFPPPTGLPEGGSIQVIFQDENTARDLTGQVLDEVLEATVHSFNVSASPPLAPQLVTTWPAPGANDINERTEFIAVFDRAMDETSFLGDGFRVLLDNLDPVPDPAPTPLDVALFGEAALTDNRAWVYRRGEGPQNEVVAIPPSTTVTLELGNLEDLLSEDGQALVPETLTFNTPAFPTPTSVALTSSPSDAIGIANLTAGDADELRLSVTLGSAAANDELSLFAFGTSLGEDPELVAIQSDVTLGDAALTQVLTLADTPLVQVESPLQAALADGEVTLAIRQRRGAITGPLRVLDTDLIQAGIQGLTLDTVAPTLEDLDLPGGGGDLFRSDLRDLTLTGRASEQLRAVNVSVLDLPGALDPVLNSAGLGGTDPDPEFAPVVGSRSDGSFIAAPVKVGVVPTVADTVEGEIVPELTYEFTLYDRALNASPTIGGTYLQRGTVSGSAVATGETIRVEVVDATSLEPIEGANVVYADLSTDSVASATGLGQVTTDANGLAVFPAQPNSTVVTIDADGYDLFTLHGVSQAWLGVSLTPVGGSLATTAGIVVGGSAQAQQVLGADTLRIADSRRVLPGSTFDSNTCTFTGFVPTCDYGPEIIRAGRVGSQAVFLGEFALTSQGLVQEFLKGFAINLPVPSTTSSSVSTVDTVIPQLLATSEEGVEATDLAVAISNTLQLESAASFVTALDSGNLVGDTVFTGVPSVVLEARFPGLDRPGVIGVGRAFELSTTKPFSWLTQAIYAPAVETDINAWGEFEEIAHFSATLADASGNTATVRTRLSQPAIVGGLRAPLVPALTSPMETVGMVTDPVGPDDFDLVLTDSLPDGVRSIYLVDGFFVARLTDANGRGWTLYRSDPDAANPNGDEPVTIAALSSANPALATPSAGLAPGPLAAVVSLRAWRDGSTSILFPTPPPAEDVFDTASFAWSDLELQSILMADSRPFAIELAAPTD